MSIKTLIEKIEHFKNPTVAGLDPRPEYIPTAILEKNYNKYGATLEGAANAFYEFNCGLIDALCDIVPAVKPQSAYYEMLGWHGVRAMNDTINYAHKKGMYVIIDAKRNDIGATAEAYSEAYIGGTMIDGKLIRPFEGDSLTVNGYLGSDCIAPFLKACKTGKSIFVLVKTSNPSSSELQDMKIADKTIYEVMGGMVEKWGSELVCEYGYSEVGAVVGATYPNQLIELRQKMPHTFFLVPGYGAQGAGAKDIIGAFDKNGRGAIVNSSRAIMCAYKKANTDDYKAAARQEAIRMRDEIMGAIRLN